MKTFDLLKIDVAKKFLQAEIANVFYAGHKIKSLQIYPIKKSSQFHQWHLVCIFKFKLAGRNKRLFFTGHSNGSRMQTCKKQIYLYQSGFNQGQYQVPKALKYFPQVKGMFYEAVVDDNMFELIELQSSGLEAKINKVAGWIHKLHNLPCPKNNQLFPRHQFNLKTLDPAKNLSKIKISYPKFYQETIKITRPIIKFTSQVKNQFSPSIIHGDLHPQNVLVAKTRIFVVDYTELALGDPLYDLGSFCQQFGFMAKDSFPLETIKEYNWLFLACYQKLNKRKFTAKEILRLNYYQAWLAAKSAIYYAVLKPTGEHLDNIQYLNLLAREIISRIKKEPNKIIF